MKTKTLIALLSLWALTILGAIITHWRIFRYLAVAILFFTILGLSISILYSLLGQASSKSKSNPESK